MDGKIFYFAEMANNSNEILCVILLCAAMLIVNAFLKMTERDPKWVIKVVAFITAVAAIAFLVLPNGNTVLHMALAGAEPEEIVNLIKEAIMKWGG